MSEKHNKHWGDNLKLIRETWGLSQEEFGLLVDATRGMIMQYEKRGSMPKARVLKNIQRVTGMTFDVLVNEPLRPEDVFEMKREDWMTIENFRSDPELFETDDTADEENETPEETVSKTQVIPADYETLLSRLNTVLDMKDKTIDQKDTTIQQKDETIQALLETNRSLNRELIPTMKAGFDQILETSQKHLDITLQQIKTVAIGKTEKDKKTGT